MASAWGAGGPPAHGLAQKQLHHPRLEFPTAASRRLFDHTPQFILIHWPDVCLIRFQGLTQGRIFGAMGIKIGTEGNNNPDGPLSRKRRFGRRLVAQAVSLSAAEARVRLAFAPPGITS